MISGLYSAKCNAQNTTLINTLINILINTLINAIIIGLVNTIVDLLINAVIIFNLLWILVEDECSLQISQKRSNHCSPLLDSCSN